MNPIVNIDIYLFLIFGDWPLSTLFASVGDSIDVLIILATVYRLIIATVVSNIE